MLIGDRSFIQVIASSISVRFYYSLNLVIRLLKKLWRRLKQFGKAICNDLQEIIFESLGSKTYAEIAETAGYDADYVKFVGFQLWQTLSNALEVKLQRTTFAQF